MDHTSGSFVSANYLPSSTDIDDYFALFRRTIELLPPHEAAKQNAIIASIQEILDQALAAEYAQDDVLLQPSPSYLSPPLPPMTPSSAPDSPADTAYEALTPSSDATLLASPTAWGSPGETTLDKGLQLFDAVEETSNHFPEGICDWYDFVQIPESHDGGAALYTGTDPLLMDERPLVASGEHAVRNGEQQYGGLAAAPNDSSHSQDVGVSADTSAVTSISTALPGSGASAVPKVQQTRKRKAKETSGQDEGSRPKKPKVSHACPHCSQGEHS
ncbi:hypothetical protein C8T65DRAFT_103019 [Cerioporus squamosus]|nr:hypothetical protein C8T65DRAFT_103019 [Cerioporus squamosus]